MSRIRLIAILAMILAMRWLPCHAQVMLTGPSYSQNFNGLSAAGSANTWTDNTTIPGWYAQAKNGFGGDYRAGSGTSTTGDLYSLGATSSSDRALGSLASGSTGAFAYGVRLQNAAGLGLTGFTVSFAAEQWRDSGISPQSLQFSYKIGTSPLTDADANSAPGAGGWQAFATLNFTGPQASLAGALDGNLAGNRQLFSTVSLTGVSLNPGEELFLRWFDAEDTGSDHVFGIDDVLVAYSPVPEPEEMAMATGLILVGVCWVRRRIKR